MQSLIIPQNRLPLYLFWFLIDNAGTSIHYDEFTAITPAYKSRIQLQNALRNIRPLLRLNGYELDCNYGFGYKCFKTRQIKEGIK